MPGSGTRADRWRDCIVDRILYNQQRLGAATLDRADRAIARGGNDIPVVFFGSPTCRGSRGNPYRCQLHGVWDSGLIAHRRHRLSICRRAVAADGGQPVGWALESHGLPKTALLPANGEVNEAYYRAYLPVIDRRLAFL